ncbi:hypothetical protein PoMZ_09319 [Pyricularia oryzae]|uniref:Uncharacterized protein n=1 Tax=Pyricularia oryzae TaxID=318829 RepID=A0A4P7MWP1_PYROR|nr:hypothetical protein PoMZ_09319 [Pyricularia oryzae]
MDYSFSSTTGTQRSTSSRVLSLASANSQRHHNLKGMEERGTRRGVLVTLEEAQIGVGCVGHVFAFEDGIAPDILSLLKTLGCGLRLASASTAAEMEACCVDVGHLWLTGIHFNDPFTATVGCQVLDIVARD